MERSCHKNKIKYKLIIKQSVDNRKRVYSMKLKQIKGLKSNKK